MEQSITPQQKLVEIARKYIGVKEEGGDNRGEMVETFQKTLGLKAGDPYCAAFVHFCLKAVDAEMGTKHGIYPSAQCTQMWAKTPKNLQVPPPPRPGFIIVWQKIQDNKPTSLGHTGIVVEVTRDYIMTVEGNTSDGQGINRDGNGVYLRKRDTVGIGSMRVLGFLDPWKA
jgi:hypothetical protein